MEVEEEIIEDVLLEKVFIVSNKEYVKLVKNREVLNRVAEVLRSLGYEELLEGLECSDAELMMGCNPRLRIVDNAMAEVDPKVIEADVPAPIIVRIGGSPSVSWGWLGSHLVLMPKGTKSVYMPRTREYRYYHYASGFGVAVLIGNAYVPTQVYIFRIKKEQ